MDSVRGPCDAERARRPACALGMLRCTTVRCLSQVTFVPDKFDPWDLNRAET